MSVDATKRLAATGRSPLSQSGWLFLSDAAHLLGVAPATLERWIRAGRIESELTQDGRIVLRRVEVLKQVLRPDRKPPEE